MSQTSNSSNFEITLGSSTSFKQSGEQKYLKLPQKYTLFVYDNPNEKLNPH